MKSSVTFDKYKVKARFFINGFQAYEIDTLYSFLLYSLGIAIQNPTLETTSMTAST